MYTSNPISKGSFPSVKYLPANILTSVESNPEYKLMSVGLTPDRVARRPGSAGIVPDLANRPG